MSYGYNTYNNPNQFNNFNDYKSNYNNHGRTDASHATHIDSSFTNLGESVRINFVKKVFSIVSVQLMVTFLMSYLSMTSVGFATFQRTYQGLLPFSGVLLAVILLSITCFPALYRTFPTNYIILAVFTLCQSYCVSFIVSIYSEKVVLMALFATAATVSGLAIYAMTTKTEIGYFSGIIAMGTTAIIAGMLISFIFGGGVTNGLISIISSLLSGIYLIYDIKLIMGGERRKLGIDDYIMAALMIYLDIINIFLEILKVISKLSGEEDKNKRRRN
jgi:FtsH-binding integral membrane protein